jgi:hypothetical protein
MNDFASAINEALKYHQACAPLRVQVRNALTAFASAGIPTPTDFAFQYTGYVEFRWHDGTTRFGESRKWGGVLIGEGGIEVRGQIRRKEGYDESGKISIGGLSLEAATKVLAVLCDEVFRKEVKP